MPRFLLLGGGGPQPWFHVLRLIFRLWCKTQSSIAPSEPKDLWLSSMEQGVHPATRNVPRG